MESQKRPRKVLLIDDSRDLTSLLCSMIKILGYETAAAYHGMEGIQTAMAFQPDVIFCDIRLPKMNGFDVAKSIRSIESLKDVYMVAITGYAGRTDMEYALESGFDRFLSKPVDLASIKQVLEEAGERQKAPWMA